MSTCLLVAAVAVLILLAVLRPQIAMDTAGRELRISQTLQCELITREGNRSTLGPGRCHAIIEEGLIDHDPRSKNGTIRCYYPAMASLLHVTP